MDHRLPDRRLPDRHDEARRRRVLAGLRAGRARPCEGGGQVRVPHVRRGVRHHQDLHVALHDARQGAGGDRLPVPGRGAAASPPPPAPRARCATSSSATTGTRTPTRTSTSCPRSWATTTWAASARFVRQANAGASDDEVFDRDRLAHELMYFSRGNPVIYYGDEQGFVGDGGDQDARQDMFPSDVASYNDDDLIATDATTAESNFDTTHPLYEAIGRLASLTKAAPGAAQRPAAVPLLDRGRRHLRVLAARPGRRPRVRRRAQQLRAGADRVHPDLRRAPRRVQPRLRRRRGHREDGRRPAAGRDRAAAVDGRLPLRRQRSRSARPRRTSRSSRCPTAARGATAPRCARSSTAARSTT